jgi:hypothetical protein
VEEMGEMREMDKTLVAIREGDEIRIYDSELWKIWNKSKNKLILGPYRAEEDETGHYVVRVFKNRHGYWLVKSWIPHFGYSWDEGRVYYLGHHLPVLKREK